MFTQADIHADHALRLANERLETLRAGAGRRSGAREGLGSAPAGPLHRLLASLARAIREVTPGAAGARLREHPSRP